MRLIFWTREVSAIQPHHPAWAIIQTPPFEPIDLEKMEGPSFSLGLAL
jgi:hypothetical protein